MEWKQGTNGKALVEDDFILAYVTNIDHDGEVLENWKARVVAAPMPFTPEVDFSNPPMPRGMPYNEKGRKQDIFMTETEAMSALNFFLGLTIKELLLIPERRKR
jgi:hypothetical protein